MNVTKAQAATLTVAFAFAALSVDPACAAVSVRDLTGSDRRAIAVLKGAPVVVGAVVEQLVHGGIPGSIYQLTCQVTDNDGRTRRLTETLHVE